METKVQAVLPPRLHPSSEDPKVEKDKNLTITADGDCWIRSAPGRTIFARTIHRDSITYKADERLYVTYGRSPSVRCGEQGGLGIPEG